MGFAMSLRGMTGTHARTTTQKQTKYDETSHSRQVKTSDFYTKAFRFPVWLQTHWGIEGFKSGRTIIQAQPRSYIRPGGQENNTVNARLRGDKFKRRWCRLSIAVTLRIIMTSLGQKCPLSFIGK